MTTSHASQYFSQSYAQARSSFLAAAEAAGLPVQSHAHPMLGRDGEALAMDVVRDGPADAQSVLIISSACHGVEGFCGSGVQNALLDDTAFRSAAHDAGVAVVYIHALNPYGFSWWRRTTQENVDLNRNFHDFSQPLPSNPDYAKFAAQIVPATWPPTPNSEAVLLQVAAKRGVPALQAIISGGQYSHADGVFYGGREPTWSHLTLRQVLRDHGTQCSRLAWIDLHTGLGPSGVGERIFSCADDAAALQRARAWWGDAVTSLYDGSSSSAPLQGLMWQAAYQECSQAEYTGIALEYGTLPILEMMAALRADQWLENHPETAPERRSQVKQQTRDAFYTNTDVWKQQIVEQAFDAAHGAVRGLSQR